jgi:outer membrane protein TolC
VGCAQVPLSADVQSPALVARGSSPEGSEIAQIGFSETVPPGRPTTLPAPVVHPANGAPAEHPANVLPINLDTVFRLACDQNGQILLAREKLQEAFANRDLADKAWLPDLFVGLGYYRHEGGIQDFQGNLLHSSFGSMFAGLEVHGRLDLREAVFLRIDAERKIWQQRGELSRLTSEQLLDAATTYIDLLAAKEGEAVSRDTENRLRKVLEKAENLAKTEGATQVEVPRIRAQLLGQEQVTRQMQKSARAASAKLAQLLGLDPCADLVPLDRELIPFTLVDAGASVHDLVSKALADGPGVRELEGLLNLVQSSQDKAQGPGRFIPIFELRMAEGAFGAGPGDSLAWDNRFDITLQAKWNLTNLATACERRRLAQSRIQQVHLSYANLRSQLSLGIQEAYEESASTREQIVLARKQIERAEESYKLSWSRLVNLIMGSSPSEVLLSAQAVAGARVNYLNALRDYNRAQLRLLVLTGTARCAQDGH